jgi:hypothetical protein
MLVALAEDALPALLDALEGCFYVPEEAARQSIRRASSFNIVHLRTTYKVDLFVAGPGRLVREQLGRRREVVIAQAPERRAWLTAPENIILRKLD